MPTGVTTLYFEADKEDDLRRVGYSKERRVDPQIVVGLLVDRSGFPLRVGAFEGNRAETTTIIPVVEAFRAAHGIEELAVVADAGMLSATNLQALDAAHLRFVVGARTTRAPGDLEAHFRRHGDAFADGQLTSHHHPQERKQDQQGAKQRHQGRTGVGPGGAHRLLEGGVGLLGQTRGPRQPDPQCPGGAGPGRRRRRETTQKHTVRPPPTRATGLSTRPPWPGPDRRWGSRATSPLVPAHLMDAAEVVSSYHELWHARASFRMSKHDLAARPVFHRTRDAIEAHLTVVMASPAVARHLQDTTGISIKRIVRTLKSLQEATIDINGHHLTAADPLTPQAKEILTALNIPTGH